MPQKYSVTLTAQKRQQLLEVTHHNKVFARRFKRAQILLLADQWHRDEIIAQMLYVGESTVHRTRQKFVDGGVEFALSEAARSSGKRKLDGSSGFEVKSV
jgi:transposase